MELLIILAMALFIFLIVLAFNQDILASTSSQFESTKAKTTLDDIANAAELVYQEGVGAKTKVFVTIPANVQSTSVSGKTLSINMLSSGNPRDVYRTVDFDIQGNIPTSEGNHWVVIESMQNYVKIGEIIPAVCGNNLKEGSEQCDDGDLGGVTCISLGYIGGTLTCSPTCTFDISGCLSQICGNNIAEGTEVCDGTDLKGQTCVSLGFDKGTLACLADCSAYDTSGCKTRKVIFSDNFDPATLNPIWQQPVLEWFRSTDVSPYLTIMQSENTGNVERYVEAAIPTTGYTEVIFKFDYDTDALDSGEYIGADWYDGAAWTNLLQNSQISWVTATYNLPASAENNPNFRIRFRCRSSTNNEECKVDNVGVSGLS